LSRSARVVPTIRASRTSPPSSRTTQRRSTGRVETTAATRTPSVTNEPWTCFPRAVR
jgi:hypothetical protein